MKYKNIAYIDTGALTENYRAIQAATSGKPVIAVVKADAYGHGMATVSRVLGEVGCSFFAVSSEEEAVELRRLEEERGRHPEILILGHILPENARTMAEEDILVTAVSYDHAVLLDRAAEGASKPLRIHIKLDTGMNRVGFPTEDARRTETVERIKKVTGRKNLRLCGIFTHFSCADTDLTEEDTGYTAIQLERYRKTLDALTEANVNPGIRHAANSAAIFGLPTAHFDAVRAGIVLYGLSPAGHVKDAVTAGIRPVMRFCSKVAHIHTVPAGDKISYGGTYTATEDRTVAVIAAGYADGYERAFHGTPVRIGGRMYKSVGRICMDQFMVDITGHEQEVGVGQEATLFGGDDGTMIETLASAAGTINYEVVCQVSKRVKRVEI